MVQYIDKDALVAEIERREKIHFNNYHIKGNNSPTDYGACYALTQILTFIDTLEVKEVDLKEEVERFAKECGYKSAATIDFQFAKHFFELGLSVSNSTKVTTPHRTKADVDVAMAEIEEKSKAFTEAHKGETTEEILAQMRGEETVNEDLEEAASVYAREEYNIKNPSSLPQRCRGCYAPLMYAFKNGAKWHKEQMMKDATECKVKVDAGGYPYIDRCIELYDYDNDIPLAKEGDKVKIVVIKGE